MSLTKYFESITPKKVNNHALGLRMLLLLALMWGSSAYAGGCNPVVEGGYGGKLSYSAVYSSCTATESAVENTVAIKYNPSDVIDKVIATQSAFTPNAPASAASIGTIKRDEYYAQDMGTSYSGNCTDMIGRLHDTPAAVSGHYYCFRFNGSAGTLYLGASFGALNTFSHATATILLKSDFVTTWKTDNLGTSDNTSITVPMVGGPYDVDWNNDGVFDSFGLSDVTTHSYFNHGTYTIRVRGTYSSINFTLSGDEEKILRVDQWGTNAWTSMERAFSDAVNLTVPATDVPDFSAVTDMSFMFVRATSANPDTGGWDTSAVTMMTGMFFGATSANPNTSSWDTSEVTDMRAMFESSRAANPNTSGWDTSKVTDMSHMFRQATEANPDTSSWDTSAVTDMSTMFYLATSANPDTSGWDTSLVTDMSSMFRRATAANPDTRGWDTSKVIDMGFMFYQATSANPYAINWDTSAVIDMEDMFHEATSFDRDIGSWNVTSLTDATDMFIGVTLSTANYDSLLVGWYAQVLQPGVTFDGGNSTYCSAEAVNARDNMIASDTWTITDGGQYCPPQVTCNVNMVASETEYFDATLEACDILSLGPDYIAADGANVTANSGWEIDFEPGFTVEQGATLNANVCGQSLCKTSLVPMPLGCHSCVDLICAKDVFCCSQAFDQGCLDMVDSVCHLVCE